MAYKKKLWRICWLEHVLKSMFSASKSSLIQNGALMSHFMHEYIVNSTLTNEK